MIERPLADVGWGRDPPRSVRLHAERLEQRARRSGRWGEWRRTDLPSGPPGADPGGWVAKVRVAWANDIYAILGRPILTNYGIIHHLAIRTAMNREPPWRDKQRIKNELFGPERTAVEVMPPESDLVDAAEMYHIWVMPEGYRMPFTIKERPGGGNG